jgi:hypothetical protein
MEALRRELVASRYSYPCLLLRRRFWPSHGTLVAVYSIFLGTLV